MKSVIIILTVLCALFSTSYAFNDTDVVYAFVNCTVRAIAAGIEGLIPPHNPLRVRSFNFSQEILGADVYFEMTNTTIYGITDVQLKKVDVVTYTNPDALSIDYDIYWPVMSVTGNFNWYIDLFGHHLGGNETYEIDIRHMDFLGLFNFTKPGQEDKGIKMHVDELTLDVTAKEVEVKITGEEQEENIEGIIETALLYVLNHVPAAFGEAIREDRFNNFWIANPEKIEQIVEWCYDNPAEM